MSNGAAPSDEQGRLLLLERNLHLVEQNRLLLAQNAQLIATNQQLVSLLSRQLAGSNQVNQLDRGVSQLGINNHRTVAPPPAAHAAAADGSGGGSNGAAVFVFRGGSQHQQQQHQQHQFGSNGASGSAGSSPAAASAAAANSSNGSIGETAAFAFNWARILQNASIAAASDNSAEAEQYPHFDPVIDLPDLVAVKSGEEDEEQLFCQRAMLFRWTDGQWKERGVGQMKVLRRRLGDGGGEAGGCRLVMRREQVHKLCCNHRLTAGLKFQPMPSSAASVCWWCVDFADETAPEGRTEQLAIRFKNNDELLEFLKVCADAVASAGSAAPPAE